MTKVVLDEEHAFASWFLPAISSNPTAKDAVEAAEEPSLEGDGEVSVEDEELVDTFDDLDDEPEEGFDFDDDFEDDLDDDGPNDDLADFYETPADLRSLHVWVM